MGINRDTVAVHRDAWLAKGVDGLSDAPRSGAPRKLPVQHIQSMCDWARAEALTAPQLRERLQKQFNIKVSIWVVQACLRREGFVFKRTRLSLKKSEISLLFAVPNPKSKN